MGTYINQVHRASFSHELAHVIMISKSRTFVSSSSYLNHAQDSDSCWLRRLDHKDWLAPNEFIKVFRHLRNPELIIDAFQKASARMDYKPTESLYTLLIERLAYARKFNSIPDLMERAKREKCKLSDEFFFKLIKIYGNMANHLDKAIETLYTMPYFNCWPTVKTFNCVLNMLVCARQFEVIHEVYLNAPRLGVSLDTCCFNILIKGLCQCNQLDTAFSLLPEISKQGCRPNTTTYSTLMHSLCQQGRVTEAFELCEEMEKNECYPDTITFNILINGLCKQQRLTEAMDLLKTMQLKGCRPNSGTYQALVHGLLNDKKFVEANDFLSIMIAEGKKPSFSSYKMIIDGLCCNNLLDDACRVLSQMVCQGFVPRMGTWKMILTCISPKIDMEYLVLIES